MSAYFVSSRGLASRMVPRGALSPLAQELFGAYEPGAMYDPEITGTLFQDSAFTVPVTAVEQPVGGMLDLSGRGNHASMATTTKRPAYSRRVNLLTKTEDFSAAAWNKRGALSITPDYMGTGLTRISSIGTPAVDDIYQLLPSGIADYSFGLLMQQDPLCTTGTLKLVNPYGAAGGEVHINLALLPTTLTYITYAHPAVTVINRLNQVGGGIGLMLQRLSGVSPLSVLIKGAQIEHGLIAGPYQWVNTATDYDADPTKFPAYLRFDGVDDALQTNAIDFTGTDKMTMWAGVTPLLAGGSQCIAANIGTTGRFALISDSAGLSQFESRGSSSSYAQVAPLMSGQVLSGRGDISGDVSVLRRNGVQVSSHPSDQGTGNYGNGLMIIGGFTVSSSHFNGRLYSLIVRGAQSSLSQIESTELYIKQKMRLP